MFQKVLPGSCSKGVYIIVFVSADFLFRVLYYIPYTDLMRRGELPYCYGNYTRR